jgi:hypothetical protein
MRIDVPPSRKAAADEALKVLAAFVDDVDLAGGDHES